MADEVQDDLTIATGIAVDDDQGHAAEGLGTEDMLQPTGRLERRHSSFVSDDFDDDDHHRPNRKEVFIPGTAERYGYISVPEKESTANGHPVYGFHHDNPSTDSIPPQLAQNSAFMESHGSLHPLAEMTEPPQAQSPPKPSFWPYPEFKSLYTASPELRVAAEMHSRTATPASNNTTLSEQPTEDIVKVLIDASNELAARGAPVPTIGPKDERSSESSRLRETVFPSDDAGLDAGHGNLKKSDVDVSSEKQAVVQLPPGPPVVSEDHMAPEAPPEVGTLPPRSTMSPSPEQFSRPSSAPRVPPRPNRPSTTKQQPANLYPAQGSGSVEDAIEEASSAQALTRASTDASVDRVASGSSDEAVAAPAAVPATKPVPPPRPTKLSSIRSQFAKTLDAQLLRGPMAPPKREKRQEEQGAGVDEEGGLADARKGRARGPRRRAPGTDAAAAADETKSGRALSISSVFTWFEVPSSGEALHMGTIEHGVEGLTSLHRQVTLEEVLKREQEKADKNQQADGFYVTDGSQTATEAYLADGTHGEDVESKIGLD